MSPEIAGSCGAAGGVGAVGPDPDPGAVPVWSPFPGPSEPPEQPGVPMTEKQRALEAVESLPDDASVEDAIERLCFIAKVKKGVSELDAGQGVPHDEVKRRVLGG